MDRLFAPYVDLFDQRNPLSYLAAAGFLFVFVAALRARRGRGFRFRALLRLVFRRSVFGHASARLDYRLYLINMPLMAFVLGTMIIGSTGAARVVGVGLDRVFGAATPVIAASPGVAAAIAVVMLLAFDFGYWVSHLAMHRHPILWQFHKLHHSAEVMTPATEFRQHPVELVLMPCAMGTTTGIACAVATRIAGPAAAHLGVACFNLVLFAHLVTFHHLRHSHINLSFTGLLGRLLHSPAHHLVHHSVEPAHHNRNLGYVLSLWDWVFGTLHLPQPNQRLVIGIGPGEAAPRGIVDAFVRPVVDAWRVATVRRAPRASIETSEMSLAERGGLRWSRNRE